MINYWAGGHARRGARQHHAPVGAVDLPVLLRLISRSLKLGTAAAPAVSVAAASAHARNTPGVAGDADPRSSGYRG